MFFLDIETLGTKQTSAVLSVGLVYLENQDPRPFKDILDNALFVKLNALHQVKAGRTIDASTVAWWKEQPLEVRERNVNPKPDDVPPGDAIEMIRQFIKERTPKNTRVNCFTRGSFDSVIMDHLCETTLGVPPLFKFWEYRDVRTAIDIIYPQTSNRSYVKINEEQCPGANAYMELKHSPDVDAALDAAMILYGV